MKEKMLEIKTKGQDSATLLDKGTEVTLLFREKGQRDKLKILPRDGMSWDSLSKSGTGRGTGRYKILTACTVLSLGTKRDIAEKYVLKQENNVLKQEIIEKNSDCPVPSRVPSRILTEK